MFNTIQEQLLEMELHEASRRRRSRMVGEDLDMEDMEDSLHAVRQITRRPSRRRSH